MYKSAPGAFGPRYGPESHAYLSGFEVTQIIFHEPTEYRNLNGIRRFLFKSRQQGTDMNDVTTLIYCIYKIKIKYTNFNFFSRLVLEQLNYKILVTYNPHQIIIFVMLGT